MTAVLAGPHIDGACATPAGGRVVDVINPATEEPIGQAQLADAQDIDRAVRAAHAALAPWSAATPGERAEVLARAAELIGERAQEIARTITLKVGSPRAIAEWQPLAARAILEWHAGQAATFPMGAGARGAAQPAARAPSARRRGRRDRALELSVRAVDHEARARARPRTGCTVVPQAAVWDAAVPLGARRGVRGRRPAAGGANVVPAGREVGEQLVRHPLVDKISFTGSASAGRRIAALCGPADQALRARAGRQVGGDRAARRRP